MNFFEHQKSARRQTRLLLPLYLLAVIFVVAAVDFICAVAFAGLVADANPYVALTMWQRLPWEYHAKVMGVVMAVIFGTSIYRVLQLRSGGGRSVARMAGGRRVSPNTKDMNERRLNNIVEEMAIASGVRVPEVYVLDREPSINAFAAGFTLDDAVVAVSRGALDQLNREELQGVIGHEFSHILNGDMRLNIRMLGTLSGLQTIGSIGGKFMRGAIEMLKHLDDMREVALAIPFFLFGLAIWIVGSLGVLAARLIQAGVSRQREFLADASSVQFTRNPHGIGGALRKIALGGAGSRLRFRGSEEFSHMAFGPTVFEWAGFLLASHPPTHERLARLGLPLSQDEIEKAASAAPPVPVPEPVRAEFKFDPQAQGFTFTWSGQQPAFRIAGLDLSELARNLSPPAAAPIAVIAPALQGESEVDIDHAANLIAALPTGVRDAAKEPMGASAIAFALLLDADDHARERQLAVVAQSHPQIIELARRMHGILDRLGAESRLPMLDLALPALRSLDANARASLKEALHTVAMEDQALSIREFVFTTLLTRALESRPPAATPVTTLEAAKDAVATLLLHVARAASARRESVTSAYSAGMKAAGINAPIPQVEALGLPALSSALETLAALNLEDKPRMMKALAAAASADGFITVNELELIRAVAAAISWPMPPLKLTTSLAASPAKLAIAS